MSDQDKSQDKTIIRVNSPAELLSVVPGLLGFMPADSLVVIGVMPPRDSVHVTLRYDLGDGEPDTMAAHALSVLGASHVPALRAVIYGTEQVAQPVSSALISAAAEAGIEARDVLRVEDGRYWSYMCDDLECCSPDGTPFTVRPEIAEQLATPVLAAREELAAQIASATGNEADAMRRATEQVLGWLNAPHHKSAVPTYGIPTIVDVLERYQRGGDPYTYIANHDVATITVGLRNLRVRDDAWSRMEPARCKAHIQIWTEVTRRARPGFVAAPASLLAFCAWQDGNGALANVALDRALADDSGYSMALLLRQIITSGAPPYMARLPMSPEEVAASYEGTEEDEPEEERCEFGCMPMDHGEPEAGE